MTHKTSGIVLRTVKYGETSVIVTIYTELFGIQSYLVNGVRISSPRGPGKANLFQPAAILELVVYHSEMKNLQRIKEFRWDLLYQNIFFDVVKNAVALFMMELLQKCLKQPEPNGELFHFVKNGLICLDQGSEGMVANFPLFFALHLGTFLGFQISNSYSEQNRIFDLEQGFFVAEEPTHSHFLDLEYSSLTSQFLKIGQARDLEHIRLNRDKRRILLLAYQHFYAVHLPDFGTMKSFPVLQAILSES
jgi:DNA repair protein RecO (recombination protein O)